MEQFLYELAKVQGVHAIGLFDCCRVIKQSSDNDADNLSKNKYKDKQLESANVMTVYRDDISHEQRQTMEDSDLEEGISQQFMRKCSCPDRSSMAQDFIA